MPAILNHEEEGATILAELWFKEKKVDSGDWYGYIAETIISAVTGVLVTCLCNNRLVSGGPVFFGLKKRKWTVVIGTGI